MKSFSSWVTGSLGPVRLLGPSAGLNAAGQGSVWPVNHHHYGTGSLSRRREPTDEELKAIKRQEAVLYRERLVVADLPHEDRVALYNELVALLGAGEEP